MIPWSSTSAACEAKLKKIRRSSVLRTVLAASIPFGALLLQIAILPIVSPFFWYVFYPAVFFSAWISGFVGGIISTFLSIILCWYYFVPPERTFIKSDPKYLITTAAFFLIGVLISILTGRLRKIIREQQQGQVEAYRREVQLREAQRIGNFGSWSWDIKNNHIEWSEQSYRIFGFLPGQVMTTYEAILDLVHPQDREFVRNSISEALTNAKAYSIDHRIICPDGTEKIVHAVADVYLSESGRPVEMIGTVHDITDRKRSEEALKESENKFRGLLETACDPIVIVNAKGLIEFANRQVTTSLGYEPAELLNQPIEIIVPSRFHASHVGQRTEYMKHPNSRSMGKNLQILAQKKDGSELPVDISLSPFRTSRGTIVTAFMRDMSERKRHEAQQKFLFDATRILSETTDYQERIQRIADLVVPPLADFCLVHILENDRLTLKASSQREFLDPSLLQQVFADRVVKNAGLKFSPNFVAASEADQLVDKIDDELLRGMVGEDSDLLHKIKSLNIQSWISVPMLTRGRNIGVISFVRCSPMSYTRSDLDFTNLVADRAAMAVDNARLYREAQNAIKLREDILAIVSHDLKNPLGVIRGFNEIIAYTLNEFGASQSDVEATEAITRSVRQMERLISDLLDFAAIESGSFSFEIKPSRVDQLIWEGIETIHHQLDKKAVQIRTEIEPGISSVNCDPDRVRQVFSNLLGNAVKFIPDYGSIIIRAKVSESEIIFSVSDNGPGISAENLPHVFDRYWQAKETAKLGTGLGLSIAKGVIDSHHGRIWVESEIGKGSTFYFTLPMEKVMIDSVP